MQDNFPLPTETKSERRKRLVAEHNAAVQAAPRARTISDLTRIEREELNSLSKDVFGASSRWQKLVNNGYAKLVTEEVTELVPGKTDEEEPTERKVQVPVKNANGTYRSTLTRYTVDSIKEHMVERKKQLDEIRAAIKKSQDEARAKKEQEQLALKVNEELSGSAL